jgi:hypothetical protein
MQIMTVLLVISASGFLPSSFHVAPTAVAPCEFWVCPDGAGGILWGCTGTCLAGTCTRSVNPVTGGNLGECKCCIVDTGYCEEPSDAKCLGYVFADETGHVQLYCDEMTCFGDCNPIPTVPPPTCVKLCTCN